MSAGAAGGGEGDAALRREHDALLARLSSRQSIVHARRAWYGFFFSVLGCGLAVKLGWDRWFSVRVTRFQGPPVYFFTAAGVAAAVVLYTLVQRAKYRRLAAGERAEFDRMRALRAALGLDP